MRLCDVGIGLWARHKQVFALLFAILTLLAPSAKAADALSFFKNYVVTGDYVVGGVGLRGTGVNGFATRAINITGVPPNADIVAAFLYWQTIESTASPSSANGFFNTKAIVGLPLGSNNTANCVSWKGNSTLRVYRADVLRYLPIDPVNNIRIANGAHTVKLPDSGNAIAGIAPLTQGASLVVVYRSLSLTAKLKAVVIYDGEFTLKSNSTMTQNVGGFYQAATGAAAKMTHIVGDGQQNGNETLWVNGAIPAGLSATDPFRALQGSAWDNLTFSITLAADAASLQALALPGSQFKCLSWGAIVTSTDVKDTDGDGLLDIWESKGYRLETGNGSTPASFGSCWDAGNVYHNNDPLYPCVDLPAMGASPTRKDIFVEIDWLRGTDGHLHAPKLAALSAVAATFISRNIQLHFDVGNLYQTPASAFIVPAAYSKGGEVVEESSLLCPNAQTNVCEFPNLPYSVQSWKIGFRAVKDGFPALQIAPHFEHNRKDIFHYSLFAHALAIPFSPATGLPKSVSGAADRPGADSIITLGLWRSDNPADDQTGSALVQAGTLMHELGHNLGLSHAGLFRAPNCQPNYPSVMNYMYQTAGLTDAAGLPRIDYSTGQLKQVNENLLTETAAALGTLTYRVRYYGPAGVGGSAKLHCDGTPITDGALAVRLESPNLSTPDWNNNKTVEASLSRDVNFDGTIGDGVAPTRKLYFVDSNDWANINLRQIGGRLNVSGLSGDVGQTDLGQTDLGQTDLGQTDLGQTDLGQTDLGQTDLGQTDLGQTDLGDVDYETTIATIEPVNAAQPLTAALAGPATGPTGIALNWGAPNMGQIRRYNIYRSDSAHPTPTVIGQVLGTPPVTTYTDTVDSVNTLYNIDYTYYVTSVDINNTESALSNSAAGIVKHLFIQANNKARVYGAANPAFDFVTTGQDPGLGGVTTCTTTATQSSNAGQYPITCSGRTPPSGVTYTAGVLTITQRPITVTAVASTKTYDGTTSSTGVPAIASALSPALVFSQTSGFSQTFDNRNVGTSKTLTPSGIVNDGNGGANYAVTFVAANTGVINRLAIAVTAVANTKVYDSTASSTGAPAIVPSLGTGDTSGFLETFDNRHVGAGKTLTPSGVVNDGNLSQNYTITFYSVNTGVITAKPITVTASTDSKNYDGTTTSTLTPSIAPALFGGDGATFTQAFSAADAGARNLVPSGSISDGNSGNNYQVTFVSTAGTISPRPITVTAVASTKTYDGNTTSAGTPVVTSALSPALVLSQSHAFTQTYANRNAGIANKMLTPAGIVNDGNGGANYAATFVSVNTGTINPLAIAVTAVADTKIYDSTTSSAGAPAIAPGLIYPDASSFLQTFDTRHAGSGKTLTPSGSVNDGNAGNNYAVTFHAVNTGVITARPITVTAAADSKPYDGTAASTVPPSIAPALLGGDTSNFTQVFDSPSVGSRTLTPSGLAVDGNGGNNYAPTFVNAGGTITPRPITVTAAAASKNYDGDATSSGTPVVTSVLSPALISPDTGAFTQSYNNRNAGVGNKTLTPSGTVNDGNGGANYAVTFASVNNGTINPLALSVTAVTDTKIYDGTNSSAQPPLVAPGLVSPDSASFLQTFANKHVGTGKLLTPSGAVSDGNGGNNYSVTFHSVNTGAITAKPITVTAQTDSKTYDGNAISLLLPSVGPSLGSGDSPGFTQAFNSKNAGPRMLVPAGAVNDGNSGNNYAVTPVSVAGSIGQRALTVTATGINKPYDTTTNATVTLSDNRIGGDVFTDSYTSATFSDPDVGTGKTVTVTGISIVGADAGNYALTSTSALTTADITGGFNGPWALNNWSVSQTIAGGTASITPPSGASLSAAFAYNVFLGDPAGGVSERYWTYQAIAPATGTVYFRWNYTGFHAYFNVTARLQVFSGATVNTLYSAGPAICCTSPSSGFNQNGVASIAVTAGQPFGFIIGGQNFDTNSTLNGTLTISQFSAP